MGILKLKVWILEHADRSEELAQIIDAKVDRELFRDSSLTEDVLGWTDGANGVARTNHDVAVDCSVILEQRDSVLRDVHSVPPKGVGEIISQ